MLFDLVKIRKLVDDATNLAVRAASGIAASSNPKDSGVFSGGASGVLGLGIAGGGQNVRLSRERKHRMRELATQKLAKAYQLDEVAASVATMQSASSLEEVASLVLARNPNDPDAKYVHFFHEKIPSRTLAKCTNLKPLDEYIAEKPGEGAPLRTRAVTKVYKDDFLGAVQDFTAALNICRSRSAHDAGLELARRKTDNSSGSGYSKKRTEEEDQPSSLESQLLFHRASTYLTIACQHLNSAMPSKASSAATTEEAMKAEASRVESAKRLVRTNARRAMRDYFKFLSKFDYTPGLPQEMMDAFIKEIEKGSLEKHAEALIADREKDVKKLLEIFHKHTGGGNHHYKNQHHNNNGQSPGLGSGGSPLPPFPAYPVHTLFTAPPPSTLRPYPPTAAFSLLHPSDPSFSPSAIAAATAAFIADSNESITYHPLLTDALHSLLLCHILIQTPRKEFLRHAYMVSRLARICDGYPVFLAPRSPARADWIEVLRRTNNFLEVQGTWEELCSPTALPGAFSSQPQAPSPSPPLTALTSSTGNNHHADCLVHSNHRQHNTEVVGSGVQNEDARRLPRRWGQEDGREYPLSTDRAAQLSKFIKHCAKLEKEKEIAEKEETEPNDPDITTPPTPSTPLTPLTTESAIPVTA